MVVVVEGMTDGVEDGAGAVMLETMGGVVLGGDAAGALVVVTGGTVETAGWLTVGITAAGEELPEQLENAPIVKKARNKKTEIRINVFFMCTLLFTSYSIFSVICSVCLQVTIISIGCLKEKGCVKASE